MIEEQVQDAHKFKNWKKNIEANGLKVNGVEEKFTRRRYNGEVLFSLLMLDAETPEGDKIPPVCFLKGEVVSVLVCLIDEKTSEKHLLLVKQRRICNGAMIYEHPAGIVDGTKTPLEIAVQEVKEETGLEVSENQLISLTNDGPYFPSTGTSDEAMYMFFCELRISKAEIDAFNDKNMGTDYEFERIITQVVPFAEGHRLIKNSNGVLQNFLYLTKVQDWENLKKLG